MHESYLNINLDALAYNYHYLCSFLKEDTTPAAVVKANAYGLGVEAISNRLYKEGCKDFFVANIIEAIELRKILPDAAIYVFHGVQPNTENAFIEHNIIPVLNSIEQIQRWEPYNKPAILHIDTGMTRLGIDIDKIPSWCHSPSNCHPALDAGSREAGVKSQLAPSRNQISHQVRDDTMLMSHLACMEDSGHPLNQQQLDKIIKIKQEFNLPICLANSGGVSNDTSYHFDMVRMGCGLYGINSTNKDLKLKQVATITAKAIQIRHIKETSYVGYGAMAQVKPGAVLATIPVGYADGYLRSNHGKGYAYAYGKKLPIIGRISMDLITIDITSLDAKYQKEGLEVELLGDNITVDEVANNADTIGYEVLTRLGTRFKTQFV